MKRADIPFDRRRRRRYIDHALQRWLLIALVLLQIGMVGLTTWMMNLRLHEMLEESVYRSHFAESGLDFIAFLQEGGFMILAFLMVNFVALIVADALWVGYVDAVLKSLRDSLARAARLDLRPLPAPTVDHEVLRRCEHWLKAERGRLDALRRGLRDLERAAVRQRVEPERLRELVAEMRAQLHEPDHHSMEAPGHARQV